MSSGPRSGYELEVHRISETIRQLCHQEQTNVDVLAVCDAELPPFQDQRNSDDIARVREAKSETLVQLARHIGNSIAALGHEQAQIAAIMSQLRKMLDARVEAIRHLSLLAPLSKSRIDELHQLDAHFDRDIEVWLKNICDSASSQVSQNLLNKRRLHSIVRHWSDGGLGEGSKPTRIYKGGMGLALQHLARGSAQG